MDKNFKEIALPLVLKYEGGFVNDPDDRGGATNKGITQKVYDDYRKDKGLDENSVRDISDSEVEEIYYNGYWLAGKCDKLSPKLSIIHFDTCVNTGVRQASKFLQRAANVPDDGIIGFQTLSAVSQMDDNYLASKYLEKRRDFYNYLANKNASQQKFLNGWLSRVSKLENEVSGLA